jgi:hypothetical protein
MTYSRPQRVLDLEWDCGGLGCPQHYPWQQTCHQDVKPEGVLEGARFYLVQGRAAIEGALQWLTDHGFIHVRTEQDYSRPDHWVIAVRSKEQEPAAATVEEPRPEMVRWCFRHQCKEGHCETPSARGRLRCSRSRGWMYVDQRGRPLYDYQPPEETSE